MTCSVREVNRMGETRVQINKPRKNIFREYVHQRIKKNKNFMVCITGSTGSGKTYSALRFGELWDKNFNSDNIVFTPKQFIDLINGGTLKEGSVIVADEFGVSMNSRNWQSVSNQMINYVLQTFRSKNYIVIFTSPDFAFIDVSARKLFHCHMMTKGINFEKKECTIKPYMLQINQRTGDIYYKFLIANISGMGQKKIHELYVALPTKQIIKEYEIKKEAFVNDLNEEIEAKLNEKQIKLDKKEEAVQNDIRLCGAIETERDNNVSWKDLAVKYGFNSDNAIRMFIKRKTNTQGLT